MQRSHSLLSSVPYLHFTTSPSGSNANRLICLGQFEGTLRKNIKRNQCVYSSLILRNSMTFVEPNNVARLVVTGTGG